MIREARAAGDPYQAGISIAASQPAAPASDAATSSGRPYELACRAPHHAVGNRKERICDDNRKEVWDVPSRAYEADCDAGQREGSAPQPERRAGSMLQPRDQQQRTRHSQREGEYDGGGRHGEIHAPIIDAQCSKPFSVSIQMRASTVGAPLTLAGKVAYRRSRRSRRCNSTRILGQPV